MQIISIKVSLILYKYFYYKSERLEAIDCGIQEFDFNDFFFIVVPERTLTSLRRILLNLTFAPT